MLLYTAVYIAAWQKISTLYPRYNKAAPQGKSHISRNLGDTSMTESSLDGESTARATFRAQVKFAYISIRPQHSREQTNA